MKYARHRCQTTLGKCSSKEASTSFSWPSLTANSMPSSPRQLSAWKNVDQACFVSEMLTSRPGISTLASLGDTGGYVHGGRAQGPRRRTLPQTAAASMNGEAASSKGRSAQACTCASRLLANPLTVLFEKSLPRSVRVTLLTLRDATPCNTMLILESTSAFSLRS